MRGWKRGFDDGTATALREAYHVLLKDEEHRLHLCDECEHHLDLALAGLLAVATEGSDE